MHKFLPRQGCVSSPVQAERKRERERENAEKHTFVPTVGCLQMITTAHSAFKQ